MSSIEAFSAAAKVCIEQGKADPAVQAALKPEAEARAIRTSGALARGEPGAQDKYTALTDRAAALRSTTAYRAAEAGVHACLEKAAATNGVTLRPQTRDLKFF